MTEPIVFNPNNPVTEVVERARWRDRPAVRKVIRPDGPVVVPHWDSSSDPTHWNLWNREDHAYTSGVADTFAADGVRSPELLERIERGDGSVELWLEDVAGRPGAEWEVADHARFARRLGAAQARATPDRVPDRPWLSRGWMRAYALSRPPGPGIVEDDEAWAHPVVVEGFGDSLERIRVGCRRWWDEHERWFALVESLPRTLCHLDCWPHNLVAAHDGTDVLVDWAFVGWGAVGEDPGNLVPDTFFDHFLEPGRFAELDAAVWQAYATGLESTGWPHDIDLARLGMVASAIKYLWLPGLMVENADHSGPTGYGGREGYPLVEVFRRRARVFDALLDWTDEARALAGRLGR